MHLHFELNTNLSTTSFGGVKTGTVDPMQFLIDNPSNILKVTLTEPTPDYASATIGSISLGWTTTGDPTAYRYALSTSQTYIESLTTDNVWDCNSSTCYSAAATSTATKVTVNNATLLSPGKKFYWRMRVSSRVSLP